MRIPSLAVLEPLRASFAELLPRGRLLPEPLWIRRHRWIVWLLALHAAGLTVFAVLQGFGLGHSLLEGAIVGSAAVFASTRRLSRTIRSVAASVGLVTSSAMLVHISGGVVEAHFHFFFVLGVLMLYQDWIPFLIAIGYVALHHGIIGAVSPTSVYNHADAIAHPWRWALIHAAFVVATSAANVVSWRVNEQLLREPLTGLPGRGLFLHRVGAALERAHRRDERLAVLFLDLDRFKMLNDSLGHSAGDRLLVATAERVVRASRARDEVARLGGDEFAVLCEGLATEADAVRIAERIANDLAASLEIAGLEVSPSASIGIAIAGGGACTAEELIGRADLAMYRAKRSNDRYVVFGAAMQEEELRTLELEAALGVALKHDELHLLYQPIVSLADEEIVGVEALLRWEHPTRGVLPPSEFIPVAERTGAIVQIGEWVLREACLEATSWPENASGRKPYVSVNLSPRQFGSSDVVAAVKSVLHETGLEARRLALEVTESLFLEDCDRPAETLLELERLGVAIVLDDFGTGYSSLSYLNRLPISHLKLDRSFVAKLGGGEPEEAVTTAIAAMAKALGMAVVAEGVESERQARALRLLGLRYAQGYHFARPETSDALNARFQAQARAPLATAG